MANEILADRLIKMMRKIAENSGGRISLTWDIVDGTTLYHRKIQFRSSSVYRFMALANGWQYTLATILKEVVMPLRTAVPDSYNVAAPELRSMGSLVYTDPARLHKWNELFE